MTGIYTFFKGLAVLVFATALPILALANPFTETNSYLDYVIDHLYVLNFDEDGASERYVYLGAESPFDHVIFDVETPMSYDSDDVTLSWEYYTGSKWLPLNNITHDNLDAFVSGEKRSLSFMIPGGWDTGEQFGEDAYWLRFGADAEPLDWGAVWVDDARVYNLEITIKNDQDQALVDLTVDNFELAQGSDNTIYGFRNLGTGRYQFALQSLTEDTDYQLGIHVDPYLGKGIPVSTPDNSPFVTEVVLSSEFDGESCQHIYTDLQYHWAQSAVRDLYCRGIYMDLDSEFEPNQNITRAAALDFFLKSADVDLDNYKDVAVPYSDVSTDHPYYSAIAAGYSLAVIDGDELFSPNTYTNRAEAVTMLVRLSGVKTENTDNEFIDVMSSDWFAKAVTAAWTADVVEGFSDSTFRGAALVTNAETAMMANNAYYVWFQ